jgi:hypothetical protein
LHLAGRAWCSTRTPAVPRPNERLTTRRRRAPRSLRRLETTTPLRTESSERELSESSAEVATERLRLDIRSERFVDSSTKDTTECLGPGRPPTCVRITRRPTPIRLRISSSRKT